MVSSIVSLFVNLHLVSSANVDLFLRADVHCKSYKISFLTLQSSGIPGTVKGHLIDFLAEYGMGKANWPHVHSNYRSR